MAGVQLPAALTPSNQQGAWGDRLLPQTQAGECVSECKEEDDLCPSTVLFIATGEIDQESPKVEGSLTQHAEGMWLANTSSRR